MRNQQIKADSNKLRMELIPPETLIALAEVLTYGASKYSDNSWKQVEPERYTGALLRHLTAYMQNNDSIDNESGIKHIDHVLCNAMFLSWFANQDKQVHDVSLIDVVNQQYDEIQQLKEYIKRLEKI